MTSNSFDPTLDEKHVEEWDIYAILGLSAEIGINSSAQDLRAAYQRMALATHPDRHPDDPFAGPKFARLKKVYEFISDESNRKAYDAKLKLAAERARQRQGENQRQRTMLDRLEESERSGKSSVDDQEKKRRANEEACRDATLAFLDEMERRGLFIQKSTSTQKSQSIAKAGKQGTMSTSSTQLASPSSRLSEKARDYHGVIIKWRRKDRGLAGHGMMSDDNAQDDEWLSSDSLQKISSPFGTVLHITVRRPEVHRQLPPHHDGESMPSRYRWASEPDKKGSKGKAVVIMETKHSAEALLTALKKMGTNLEGYDVKITSGDGEGIPKEGDIGLGRDLEDHRAEDQGIDTYWPDSLDFDTYEALTLSRLHQYVETGKACFPSELPIASSSCSKDPFPPSSLTDPIVLDDEG